MILVPLSDAGCRHSGFMKWLATLDNSVRQGLAASVEVERKVLLTCNAASA